MNNFLLSDIEIEIQYLNKTVDDINGLLEITSNREITVYDSAAASMLVSQFYNGIENVLKLILKHEKISLPYGDNSHIELFIMFESKNEYSNIPILFTQDIVYGFSILRRFRHFARHGYAYNIDWERLKEGMSTIEILYFKFKTNLNNYLNGIK